jgi:hypothetical protein
MANPAKTILKELHATIKKNRKLVDTLEDMVEKLVEVNWHASNRDPIIAAVTSTSALSLKPSDLNYQLLRNAFADTGLDPEKPLHWRLLLESLVEVCFRGPGAKKKWDEAGLFELFLDIEAIQKSHPGLTSNPKIAQRIKGMKSLRERYKTIDTQALTKLVRKARSPIHNPGIEYRKTDTLLPLLKRQNSGSETIARKLAPLAETVLASLLTSETEENRRFALKEELEKQAILYFNEIKKKRMNTKQDIRNTPEKSKSRPR